MRFAALAVALLATITIAAQEKKMTTASPDVIFVNANIWTGVAAKPHATAIAIGEGSIVAIGTDAEIKKLASKNSKVIDLGGKFVMPGFNDAHLHFASGGMTKLQVELAGTKSLEEMKSRIAEKTKTAQPGEWILGRGWDQTKWTKEVLPTRQDLDEVTAGHPAYFGRTDGHIAIANSAALKFAGITRDTKPPAGGQIDLDANGEPTGILRESAKEFLNDKIPPPAPAQRRRGIELALQEAAEFGLTSIQDNSEWADFLVYEELEREGKLTVRIAEWLPFGAPIQTLQQHRSHHPGTDRMLHTTMLKGYMDGSLGSSTAVLLAPYSDDPNKKNKGLAQFEQSNLNQMSDERADSGFQLGFHAIGDGAAQMALDAFADAERYVREHSANNPQNAKRDFRFRIEHAQVITPDQFDQFKKLGVIASMQPNHLLTDMFWAEHRIGPERAKHSYAWREFLQHGVPLAFGTDYPVEPLTPFRGVYAAVTRKSEDGKRTYYPEQKLTIAEALAAYTTGAAYAEFAESYKGTLANGMVADLVVLDRDLTKIPPEQILGTKVLRTVVGGKTVYESK
jgi:predicted amidohydrolase YtcJ